MSVFAKIRSLSKYGIITDQDPYDLPPEAFSAGVNVRFRNGHVSRAPVFRDAATLSVSDPRFAFASNPTSGQDLLFVGYKSGRIYLTSPSSQTNYSISGYVDAVQEGTWSGTHLADCVYINRPDRVPWVLTPSGTAFAALANWDSTWRANLLRSCGGALVALNVTKGATANPSMVKTSSFPTSGVVPASWDDTDPSTLATENILAELEGGIIDAQNFANNLVIYGHDQTWLMQKVATSDVFDYYKLPFSKGAINANCSVEIDGFHYVFGPDDIWRHDGVTEQSICTGRTHDFIFAGLNASQASRCFVQHNPLLKEIYFCYVSGDSYTGFLSTNVGGCNRCATYNYVDNTWTFDDLPSVYGSAYANLSVSQEWANVSGTWSTIGGSWLDEEDGFKRTPVFVGDTQATYSLTQQLYAFDLYGAGSTTTFAVDTHATMGAKLYRDGIDLDEIQGVNLPDYKVINSIYPLARIDAAANTTLNIQVGSSDYYGQAASFDESPSTYDGNTLYKLDFNMAGRYLSMIISYNDYTTFSISGFDIEVDETGQR